MLESVFKLEFTSFNGSNVRSSVLSLFDWDLHGDGVAGKLSYHGIALAEAIAEEIFRIERASRKSSKKFEKFWRSHEKFMCPPCVSPLF